MTEAEERWHAFAKSGDPSLLADLIDADAVFESPVVHTPQRGRAVVCAYLSAAVKLLNGDTFRYLDAWRNERGLVLEFETEIDGVRINGVDIITFSEDGHRITHFKVMVRPLKAINLLHRLMGEALAKA